MEKGKGGGILRSEKNGGGSGGTASRDHGHVSFSNNNVETRTIPSRTPYNNTSTNNGGGGYDSDDVEDSIMASGDTFAMGGGKRGDTSDDHDMNDASVKTLKEVEEAKRRRGRVRRREDELEGSTADFDKDDNKHYANNNDMSLITDQDKNPDDYETNAGINAECPVEPFNMNAEKDGGLGYFDGDTYVFRHNQKPVDGEDDAWLDGVGEDNEKETGGGGLDSTSIWKPSDAKSAGNKEEQSKRKSKFVSEDDIPEDIGRRMATLLQDDNETVMMALTRHGASIRQLQSQQQKLAKKSKIKKRKSSKSKKEDDTASTTSSSSDNIDAEMKQLKIKVEQTRECVEELTELADALLFGGETEAYELTKSDWIHKFKLEQHFPSSSAAAVQRKRPLDGVEDTQTKKKSKGYFDTTTEETKTVTQVADNTHKPPEESTVMWEYKGNEDGTIHGPYTSQQMKDWTSCGYFVGESAVDIRRVGRSDTGKSDSKQKSKDEDTKADVDDLMADLMDDDEEETKKESEDTSASWMRSDRVDFSLYI